MKTLLLILSVLVLNINLYSQRSEDEKNSDIKQWYKEIMTNINSYEKRVVESMDESTEGGEITYYLKDDNVKLIKAVYYGETGNSTYSYYFRNNKLFFMFQVKEIYDVPIYIDNSGKGTKEENRFYFYGDELIRWLDNKKQGVDITKPIYLEKEKSIIEEAYKLFNKL